MSAHKILVADDSRTIRALVRRPLAAHGYDVILASDGVKKEHETFVEEYHLEAFPYLLSAELGIGYRVGRLPHAVLIDGDGVIRSTGLLNSREHLESLFEASERGVASLQEYMAAQANEEEVA